MRSPGWLQTVLNDTLATALGREHRADPVLARSGGPAGNARLTAWTGLVLLVLFLAELVTLLDVRGFIGWHLALGVALLPPALLKTGSTGWRILRYYTGNPSYRRAGPPPPALRVLGPLVVVTTLGLLGTGLALVLLGAESSRVTLLTVVVWRVDTLTLHQAAFAAWAVATGLHVLARTLPAWQLVSQRSRPPGVGWRGAAVVLGLAVSVALVGWVLAYPGGWRALSPWEHHDDGRAHAGAGRPGSLGPLRSTA